ncbi:Shedu immune nuclease family protein [Bdellovibrio bacteriovorus]|uniref:Shedu immune nuclease family protein n=1 Tax=Bdellovibrio bacteriovorus TaxID=959 RepID=UPI0035A5A9C3
MVKKTPDNITIKKTEDGKNTLLKINHTKKLTEYHIQESDRPNRQKEFLKSPIILDGFTEITSGLYNGGFGLTPGTSWHIYLPMVKTILKGEFNLFITSRDDIFEINKQKKSLTISHNLIKKFNAYSRAANSSKNTKVKYYVLKLLSEKSEHIPAPQTVYQKGDLDLLEKQIQDTRDLSQSDISAVSKIYQKISSSSKDTTKRELGTALESKIIVESVYLKKVIAYFEKNLEKEKTEHFWQEFLQDNVILFNSNYVSSITKKNISLKNKIPDFLLLDQYGYIDIFEIKKPQTKLLKFDSGRGNYYWGDEISKAIIQVEKYMTEMVRHSDALSTDMRNEGINVNIIRPRSVILAGSSKEFKENKKMADDFRVLSQSCRNIQFVLFDDYLSSLKNLANKLTE